VRRAETAAELKAEPPRAALPRIHVDEALAGDAECALPDGAARHVQVLRLQPGDALTLFDGLGGQWSALIVKIGRQRVDVRIGLHEPVERELPRRIVLALGMPANDRMDALIEKATELGAAAVQPLICERSVLRLTGDRAQRRAAHWRSVAIAACEQCGRNRVPGIAEPLPLAVWLRDDAAAGRRLLLSLDPGAAPIAGIGASADAVGDTRADASFTVLSGPEGGLSDAEIALAVGQGFEPVGLGPRVLRADTAPIAALVLLGRAAGGPGGARAR
jgi:16S rRNA (uracil1498-N3)-methyltransferase